ncbi:hypothetical protein HKCCE4037_06515 [Rhodobacterales bacterium HKCCE4037]|nr:hypothetical protein [Rhodobacterales bacterium HKCCE4037]
MSLTDTRLDESKSIPMREVIDRLGIAGLKPAGQELVGPCPICGGRDRFAVNIRSHLSNCRKCGLRAGDQVGLVQAVLGLKFREALAVLMGEEIRALDPAEVERRRERARAEEQKQERLRQRFRNAAIARGMGFWHEADGRAAPELFRYLEARGIPARIAARLAPVLRYHPNLPYVRRIGRELVTLHTGPAMIAKIQSTTADLGAHCTWLDPNRPGAKARITARIEDNKGEPWPAKLIHGSTKGGCITLTFRRAPVLVMGEGIETTLTALAADRVEGADYWAGISLGNMAGRMRRDPARPRTPSGWPDMTDTEAFVPPPWVERLIFIQDGDSEPVATRAKLLSGLRRAMGHRPGLKCQIVHAGKGVDLNDLVKPEGEGNADDA